MEIEQLALTLAKVSFSLCVLCSLALLIAKPGKTMGNLAGYLQGGAFGLAAVAMLASVYAKTEEHSSRHDDLEEAINKCKTTGGQPALTLDQITFHMSTDRFLCLDRGIMETNPLHTSGAE